MKAMGLQKHLPPNSRGEGASLSRTTSHILRNKMRSLFYFLLGSLCCFSPRNDLSPLQELLTLSRSLRSENAELGCGTPVTIRQVETLDSFKSKLKTYCFECAFIQWVVAGVHCTCELSCFVFNFVQRSGMPWREGRVLYKNTCVLYCMGAC